MNMLQIVMENGGQSAIRQVAQRTGLSESQANQLFSMILPALGEGVRRNVKAPSQREGLMNALAQKKHQQVLEQPETLAQEDAIQDGNAILGHLFGSKDVSRNVASRVAERSGTEPDIVKQLLPMAAKLVMGALSKETEKRGMLNGQTSSPGTQQADFMGSFMDFFDMNNDGSVMDDLSNIARKFFK
ncbi:MAG: DUF937 domain-containing protein [Methylothermaceae bacterium]|nr:DUF937 domain-containing protein [Methylothermaceae bacterium]